MSGFGEKPSTILHFKPIMKVTDGIFNRAFCPAFAILLLPFLPSGKKATLGNRSIVIEDIEADNANTQPLVFTPIKLTQGIVALTSSWQKRWIATESKTNSIHK
jgi:hypothetical protein